MDRTKCEVLRIHGTFAARDLHDGDAWWQQRSEYHEWLNLGLEASGAGVCADATFHWDGLNSEYSRRRAGAALAEVLSRYESGGGAYSLIGHSHGGGVMWEALSQAERRHPGLPGLQRWVTVGTPFLLYRPDRFAVLASAIPLVGAVIGSILLLPTVWVVYQSYAADFVAWREYWYWGIAPVLLVLLFVLTAVAGLQFADNLRNALGESRRIQRQRHAYGVLKSRHVPIVAAADEAISGIAATFAFEGEVTPRVGMPGIRIVTRWISMLADQLVWLQLSRKAQGSDIPGILLDDVLPLPQREPGPLLLSEAAEGALILRAEQRAQSALAAVRQSLAKLAFEGRALGFLTAAAGESGAAESLVHTSYFDEPEVRRLTLAALTGTAPMPANALTPGAKRTVPEGRSVRILFALLFLASVIALAVGAASILWQLRPEVMILDAVKKAPLSNAIWEDPDTPQAYLMAIGRTGRGALVQEALLRLSQAPDRARAKIQLALGLEERGASSEAVALLKDAAVEARLRPAMRPGEYGPSLSVSFTAIDLARAYARTGDVASLDALLGQFDGSGAGRSALAQAAVRGFIEKRQFVPAVSFLSRIENIYERRDAFLEILKARPGEKDVQAALDTLPALAQQEVLGDLFAYLADAQPAAQLASRLSEIENTASYVRAACAIARKMDREDGLQLLEDTVHDLPKRKRSPLDGHALLYARLAEAFLDLRSTARGLALLQHAASLGPEKVGDTTYDDDSFELRAKLWARLGNAREALGTARRIVNQKEEGIRSTTSMLASVGHGDEARQIIHTWSEPDEKFEAMLGLLDASPERRGFIRSLESDARRLDDPKMRSRYLAEIGLLWVKEGNAREAIRIADACSPADHLLVLTQLLH